MPANVPKDLFEAAIYWCYTDHLPDGYQENEVLKLRLLQHSTDRQIEHMVDTR